VLAGERDLRMAVGRRSRWDDSAQIDPHNSHPNEPELEVESAAQVFSIAVLRIHRARHDSDASVSLKYFNGVFGDTTARCTCQAAGLASADTFLVWLFCGFISFGGTQILEPDIRQ
jgi:hypothetical protein